MDKFLIDYMGTRFEVYGAAAKAVAALVDECAELRAENERLKTAIENCLEWANGRQSEWGERAENAFEFLINALEETEE